MRRKKTVEVVFALVSMAFLCGGASDGSVETLSIHSPKATLAVSFRVSGDGMQWSLSRRGDVLVEWSRLGLDFIGTPFAEVEIVSSSERASDVVWTTGLSRRRTVRDCYRELSVTLEEKRGLKRRLGMVFRAYEEGMTFRYVVPEQSAFDGFQLRGEHSEWRFPADAHGWFTVYPSHVTSQEQPFVRKPISCLGNGDLVGMPAVVEVKGQFVALCEADLTDWAGMFFRASMSGPHAVLKSAITPLPPSNACDKDVAVIRETPAKSPWRVAICGDSALDLVSRSDIVQNLNPPPHDGMDFGWVKPGVSSWDWWVDSNNTLSTESTLRLVDFAAEMGWSYHTIDGGWYGFARRPNHGPGVKVKCRKGFDLERIVKRAAGKGVGIWVWLHWEALDDNGVDETLEMLSGIGVKGVKIDFMDRQDQWMVCWYEKVARTAAKHRIMVNFHGAYKPTGMERTWPNAMTREGILGNEMLKFNRRLTLEHMATLPFTRFLLGPGDYTPGGFANVRQSDFIPQTERGHRYGDERDSRPIWAEEIGTRAHALALCIAYESPLTTLCDWPDRYRGAKGVEALRALPTTWRNTVPVCGEIGSHYAVLRETHDGRFYFAAFTVSGRRVDLKLDFLDGKGWKMRTFCDDPAKTPANFNEMSCGERSVRSGETVSFNLLDEGGAVAIFERQ